MALVRHALRRAAGGAGDPLLLLRSSRLHTHSTSRTLTPVLAATQSPSAAQHPSSLTSPSFSRSINDGTSFSPLEEEYAAQKALDERAKEQAEMRDAAAAISAASG